MERANSEIIAAAPLYQDLTPDEIVELTSGMELRRFAAGEALMTQGGSSDGAYVVAHGEVEVATRLPGGGETSIARLGPGDVVGEMALLMRGGRRTATARAVSAVDALFIDHRYFEAALHMLRPASLKVLRRLGLMTAERLRAIRARSRALVDAAPAEALFRPAPGGEPWPAADFAVRDFLPILPCFRDFNPGELDAVFEGATVEQAPRGAVQAEEGAAPGASRIVVRGALLLGHRREGRIHQLDILGPGRFALVAPVLEGAVAGATVMAAEDSVLLAIEAERLARLWRGQDRLALRLLEAVNADLVLSLNTASNHLTRLTAQARLRDLVGGG